MVHPAYRFHGLMLMKALFAACSHVVSCDDMPATIKVTQWLGATEAGRLDRYVKVLSPKAAARKLRFAASPAVAWPFGHAMCLWDKVWRNVRAPGVRVERVGDFDIRFEAFFKANANAAPTSVAKSLRFLQWRYGPQSPHTNREIAVVRARDGRLRGYVIYRVSDGGEAGDILDLQAEAKDRAKLSAALLGFATHRLRQRGAWLVRYRQVRSERAVSNAALLSLGFVRRGGHRLLVRFPDGPLAATARRAGSWNISYGDSEASYGTA
jgi:hypothetical protein